MTEIFPAVADRRRSASPKAPRALTKAGVLMLAAFGLNACDDSGLQNFDFDIRDKFGSGLDTSASVRAGIQARPKADARGVISYPTYQVAVARRGDTVEDVAQRVGIKPAALASFNGMESGFSLRKDEVLALPSRVSEPLVASATTLDPADVDLASLAGNAIDRAADDKPRPAAAPEVTAKPLIQTGPEPIRHKVERGETAFSVARLYDVPVASLSEWNGLGPDLAVREGQFLLVPVVFEQANSAPVTTPGTGTKTPTPPSAARPQPSEETQPAALAAATPAPALPKAPELNTTTSPKAGLMAYPARGDIIRAYKKGRNEGIDISAPAGTAVTAADKGVVAAISRDTNNVPIIVIKHPNNLLTVYTNVGDLRVKKGANVSRGQRIASVRAGDPSFVHFEIRDGLQSVDPARYLDP